MIDQDSMASSPPIHCVYGSQWTKNTVIARTILEATRTPGLDRHVVVPPYHNLNFLPQIFVPVILLGNFRRMLKDIDYAITCSQLCTMLRIFSRSGKRSLYIDPVNSINYRNPMLKSDIGLLVLSHNVFPEYVQ